MTVGKSRSSEMESGLGDEYFPCALVDASAKHKILPLAIAVFGGPVDVHDRGFSRR